MALVLPDSRPGREGISGAQAFACAVLHSTAWGIAFVSGKVLFWNPPTREALTQAGI